MVLYSYNSGQLDGESLLIICKIVNNLCVNAIHFDKIKKSYYIKPNDDKKIKYLNKKNFKNKTNQYYRGLTNILKDRWFGSYKKNKNSSDKKSSSKEIGTRVHEEIKQYLVNKSKEGMHSLTKSTLKLLEEKEKIILASEIPCVGGVGNYITQCDLIVLDKKKKRIEMIELKTGLLQGSPKETKNVQFFKHPLEGREINEINKAELQMMYTYIALKKTMPDIKISKCRILNSYVTTIKKDDGKMEEVSKSDFVRNSDWFKIAFENKKDHTKLLEQLNI